MILLDGSSPDARRARSRSPTTTRRSGSRRTPRARVDASRARRRSPGRAATTPVYGINTGFGALAETRHPARRARRAAAQPAAQPRRRRRRAAAGARRARDDGAARQRAGQGLLRHPPRDARAPARRCSTAACIRACRAAARSARAATSRRSRTWRWCSSAKARRRSATTPTRRSPGATRSRAAGLDAGRRSAPKEGLALINGTQPSTAVAALAVAGAERLARAADIAAALSIDALRGSVHPFDARIHAARPYAGQVALGRQHPRAARRQRHQRVARELRPGAGRLLAALRGAGARRGARGASRSSRRLLDDRGQRRDRQPDGLRRRRRDRLGRQLSRRAGGASPPTLLAIALAQLATISERRSDRLVNPALSGLPAFLTADSGLQSGYMMAQVTAAALTSEIKTLAHPASVDTIPTSANREDHVSMSMGAALKAARALDARDARHRGRDAVRVPGDRSARAARRRRRARSACTRACAIDRADARRRSSAGARHRGDCRR